MQNLTCDVSGTVLEAPAGGKHRHSGGRGSALRQAGRICQKPARADRSPA